MIMFEFSDEDRAALGHGRYHEPHAFVRQKMEVLWLKSLGLAHKDICRAEDVCPSTTSVPLLVEQIQLVIRLYLFDCGWNVLKQA